MVDDDSVRADLLQRIESRRAAMQAYLQQNRPRVRHRATITVVLTTLAAVSTAGPAVGGENFVGGVERALGLSNDSYVWRTLCLLAMVVSVSAAILTNLNKSEDQVSRLATAEAVDSELEGLSLLLEFGQLGVEDAVKLYQQYTAKATFVPDLPVPVGGPATVAAPSRVGGPATVAAPSSVGAPRRSDGLPAVPPPRPRTRKPPPQRPRPPR